VDYYELQKSIELDWTRGLMRGASTITQQLAKNLYLSPSRNPIRKFRELIIARRLEAELDKARIFEIYLNVIEWGDGIWGAEAAARTYYGVPSAALGPSQAALLAGAIINPRLLNPAEPAAAAAPAADHPQAHGRRHAARADKALTRRRRSRPSRCLASRSPDELHRRRPTAARGRIETVKPRKSASAQLDTFVSGSLVPNLFPHCLNTAAV
jgi:membrane peptidoglycan carboxypeptidase